MGKPLFRFGAFRLDPHARELFENGQRVTLPLSTIDCLIYLIQHRDRPVGRDELAAGVWGRVDVSEVSLSHAIMRLRRLLGDDGNAQRVIRTVPRLGYRWVMEVDSDAPGLPLVVTPELAPETNDAPCAVLVEMESVAAPAPTPALPGQFRRRIALGLAVAVAVALAAGFTLRSARHSLPSSTAIAQRSSAMVLPASVEANPEWAWLRLGLMDLVATRLRRAGLPTTPSETVVALVNAQHAADADLPAAALLVRPTVAFAHGEWHVRLQAHSADRALEVEARADDAVKAARNAVDELLIKLGHTPATDDGDDAALATLRQRINAAVLAGQLEVARRLIDEAPADLQASPEIALGKAKIAFFSGEYDACRHQIERLLERLPAQSLPHLRARALNTLGAAYFRQGRIDQADQAYAEAVRLMEAGHEPNTLANAYIGRGGVASQRLQLEQAAADYGRARTLLEMSNDAFGVAAVDLNLGMNAMQRGQPATALPLLRSASERFGTFAADDALAASLIALVDAESTLLEHDQALAVSERFAALEAQGGNRRQRWELTVSRARALAGVGRLAQAEALIAQTIDASDPSKDALARAQADALGAGIHLDRGDFARSAELAAAALTALLEEHDRPRYAAAWLTRIHALQRSGAIARAADEIARMRGWSDTGPADGDRVLVALAEADQAGVEGHDELALQRYAQAMTAATARGIPQEMVAVGQPYVRRLIDAGRLDDAMSVNGRIAPWADRDVRAASTAARLYAALNKPGAAAALDRARHLAGERPLIDVAAQPPQP